MILHSLHFTYNIMVSTADFWPIFLIRLPYQISFLSSRS